MLVLGWRVAWPLLSAGGARALLCAASIGQACESGLFTAAQLQYMRVSASSRDARDIVWHRTVARTCAALKKDMCAMERSAVEAQRLANNQLMHALELGDGDALDQAMSAHMRAMRGRK
jgi:hypothetical protein